MHDLIRDYVADVTRDAVRTNGTSYSVAVDARYLTTIGPIPPGASAPTSGQEHWIVTLELWFPEEGPKDEPNEVGLAISRVIVAIEDGVSADPTLGGKVRRAAWRGTDGDHPTSPLSKPDAELSNRVEAGLRVTV